jgi:hypothetical protein
MVPPLGERPPVPVSPPLPVEEPPVPSTVVDMPPFAHAAAERQSVKVPRALHTRVITGGLLGCGFRVKGALAKI